MLKKTGICFLMISGLCLAVSCTVRQGNLDDSHNRQVEKHIRDISQTSLSSNSTSEVKQIDDEIDSMKKRRETQIVESDEPVALSIESLRVETLQNNLDLRAAFVEPSIADARIDEKQGKFDPTFFGGVEYKKANSPRLDGDLVQFTADDKDLDKAIIKLNEIEQTKEKLNFDLGVEVPLATGAKVKVMSYINESNKLEPQRFEQYVSGLKFSVSQPLLRGAGFEANTAMIKIARLNAQASRVKTKLSAIKQLVKAEKAYWKLYEKSEILRITTEQYNQAYDNFELVKKRVEEGLSARIEIIRAELGVASRLEKLIIAETNYKLAERELKRIMNRKDLPIDSENSIFITEAPSLLRFILDPDQLVQDALNNRLEMLELELKLAADALKIDLAENAALPVLDLKVEYGISDRNDTLGSSFRGMWDFDNDEFAVGVRGEVPMTNILREAQLRRIMLKRVQRIATQEARELTIRQDVYNALDILDQNWQRILAARQNVIVSGINYEAELNQFEQGIRTMREVIEALTSLGDAQMREVKSIVAYQIAQIELAYVTGTILSYSDDALPIEMDYDQPDQD